jgi:hypothetical protein
VKSCLALVSPTRPALGGLATLSKAAGHRVGEQQPERLLGGESRGYGNNWWETSAASLGILTNIRGEFYRLDGKQWVRLGAWHSFEL